MMLLLASTALIASSALAAPQLPVRPPVISPATGNQPNLADYPLEIACKTVIYMDVVANDIPKGWGSYGMKGVFRGAEASYWEEAKKDEMRCNYVSDDHPDIRITSLRFYEDKGTCIVNPTKPGFRCKSGTVPSMK